MAVRRYRQSVRARTEFSQFNDFWQLCEPQIYRDEDDYIWESDWLDLPSQWDEDQRLEREWGCDRFQIFSRKDSK
jgi:hypothetical protein